MDHQHKQTLIVSGALLFLIGLLTGVAVQAFSNPRMGLSSHLAGVQNALFLLTLGALWQHLRLPPFFRALAAWSAIYGMYVFWLALTLAAAWGTSRATPIAGAGFGSIMWKEGLVQVLLYSASLSSIVGATLLVVGFWRRRRLEYMYNRVALST